jgi:hypothetical protein
VSALALAASGVVAQQLGEVCPGAQPGTGALWGLVTDADAGIGLPGATVVATWETDGDAARTEGQTALDGSYVLCNVPLGVEVSVQPFVAALGGAVVVSTLTHDFLQVTSVSGWRMRAATTACGAVPAPVTTHPGTRP